MSWLEIKSMFDVISYIIGIILIIVLIICIWKGEY